MNSYDYGIHKKIQDGLLLYFLQQILDFIYKICKKICGANYLLSFFDETFMFMCKKETRREKAIRGKKYLEIGLRGIQFSSYKTTTILPKYTALSAMYDEVLQDL